MYDPLKTKAKIAMYTVLAFLMGMGMASGLGWTDSTVAMPVIDEAPQVSASAVRPAQELSDAFVEIAEVVTPAVVRIQARKPAEQVASEVPAGFDRFFGPEGEDRRFDPQPQIGSGSGFIVSPDGYILTNDHVVSGADQIQVFLTDRRYYDAQLVGADPFTDVAVIKIEAPEQLPTLSFGDSDEVRVGEWVVAIGNPGFGAGSLLDYTVTAGIVSARGRALQLINNELARDGVSRDIVGFAIEDFIQTDAVINPGNSGGPMVDLQGRVVGINSAIASQSGFYMGYGFAIPVNLARRVMEDLVEYGYVRRPLIGVSMLDVAPEDAQKYGLPRIAGALITAIRDDGPARAAGLQPEDVIYEVEGETVGYSSQLQQRIAQYHPGDEVEITVYRDGRPMTVELTLDEAPISSPTERAERPMLSATERLGIELEELTEDNFRQWGYVEPGGTIIGSVERASAAFLRGIAGPGEKIIAVDRTEVASPAEVRAALEAIPSGTVLTLHLASPNLPPRFVNIRMPT